MNWRLVRSSIVLCFVLFCCSAQVFAAAPSKSSSDKKQVKKGQLDVSKAKNSNKKKVPALRANTTPKAKDKSDDDDLEEDRVPYRRRRRNNRYRRYRSYRYYRNQRYRKARRKQKGPRWQHDRFFWSTEIGYSMFRYSRYTAGIEAPFMFNSLAISGRWGYASRSIIFTGDILYAFGGADGHSDGGFMGHLGVTLGILPVSWVSIDLGLGLEIVTSFDRNMTSPAMLLPLETGFTLRLPLGKVSLGIRFLGSFSFGDRGMGIGFRSLLVLGST